MNHRPKLALLSLSIALTACSALQSDKAEYKSAGRAPTLEVPPDLTQLSKETRYVVPGAAVTASGFQVGQAVQQATPTAANVVGEVRIERAGNQRWLVVNQSADKLWEPVKDFWVDNGFLLLTDQPNLGIMETDWAENRAKLPQDFIRQTLGKLLDSLYSTGERDKFRTRLERNPNGGTDIFISHRGMIEVYSDAKKEGTVWQPRPVDPELEAEFLRRLMLKLGVTQEQTQALLATGAAPQTAQIVQQDGQNMLRLNEGFERAWRRVGLALDRTNFTVEDRDRSKGLYFVRYVAPVADKQEQGFFSKLFSSSKVDNAPRKYRVKVGSADQLSTVSVQNLDGNPANPEEVQAILKVLAEDLK